MPVQKEGQEIHWLEPDFLIFDIHFTIKCNNTITYIFFPRMIIAYIMIPLVQKELDTFRDNIWNCHRIRQQKDTVLPNGIPNQIHSFPDEYELQECGMSSFHV